MVALAVAATPLSALAEPYVMDRTDVRDMISEDHAHYRIFIHRPKEPAPETGYPVLYLLDGEDSFPVAAQTSERMARFGGDEGYRGVLVVAIGYPPGDSTLRRAFDYTPVGSAEFDPRGRRTGGADAFRSFLANTLKPAIGLEFCVDQDRKTIWGHSYGGLFVIDTLLQHPDLFDSYAASSPAIWLADEAIEAGFEGLADRLEVSGPRVVALSVGAREQEVPEANDMGPAALGQNERIKSKRMVDRTRELAQRLGAFGDLTVQQRVSTGEDHAATALSGIGMAVQLAAGKTVP
ncbi:alpha/beta hydrolase [Qipengyuania sp. NPDC077410]|uniref:alpha/beta hydrolase n=1 Tax=Qipengyuania sp. NPDC077410 TaxID=3364496 RepID=UPI0037C67101